MKLYLLQSHSQSDVSRRHGGDFYKLISKRHQQSAHPLATQNIIQKNYSFSRLEITQGCVAEMKNYVRAVPVDVVDSSLWFKSAGVNPNKYQRTTLLVVDNLEGQSTQVILVPPPVG